MTLKGYEQVLMEDNLPTARHEFGHHFVARELGFQVGSVQIASKHAIGGPGGGAELDLLFPIFDLPGLKDFCERRVKVLMAGVLAEAMEDCSIDHERARIFCRGSGLNDFAKWRELLRLLRNIEHPGTRSIEAAGDELQKLADRLWNEAAQIVLKHCVLIEKLACELAMRRIERTNALFTANELAQHEDIIAAFGAPGAGGA